MLPTSVTHKRVTLYLVPCRHERYAVNILITNAANLIKSSVSHEKTISSDFLVTGRTWRWTFGQMPVVCPLKINSMVVFQSEIFAYLYSYMYVFPDRNNLIWIYRQTRLINIFSINFSYVLHKFGFSPLNSYFWSFMTTYSSKSKNDSAHVITIYSRLVHTQNCQCPTVLVFFPTKIV